MSQTNLAWPILTCTSRNSSHLQRNKKTEGALRKFRILPYLNQVLSDLARVSKKATWRTQKNQVRRTVTKTIKKPVVHALFFDSNRHTNLIAAVRIN